MRRLAIVFSLLAGSVAVVMLLTGFQSGERVVPRNREQARFSYAPVVKTVTPAVVNVYVRQRVQQVSPFMNDPFFQRFFGKGFTPSERIQNSLGSGVMVSPDGLVVTNNHVIQTQAGANAGITVALADNREFEAKVILKDERSDLAVLRIQKADEDFPYLKFGDSDALEVGDIVLAIGNPLGIGQTVTTGIVSALARTRIGISDYQFFIQTDAAINPGNSGGALVDVDGKLVGINTAIYSQSGGSQGLGFAIPVNMVKLVVDSAIKGGRVQRPWLGAELQPLTQELAQAAGLDRAAGAIVAKVHTGGPAEAGGLRDGDVILGVDGHNIADPRAFLYFFTTKGTSGSVKVEASRGGKKIALSIALMPPPENPPRNERQLAGRSPFAGAKIANLSPAVAEELAIEETSGVVVMETEADSTARRVGFHPGDIVVEVNGEEIKTVEQLQRVTAGQPRVWRLVIRRGGRDIVSILRV